MSQAHNYNVLIIILCSLYNSTCCTWLHFPILKWFQSYFKKFKTIMVKCLS